MTRIDLPTQDFHEAVPGHHFQTALAQEQSDAPLLRRLITFNAYSEGWALYAEELRRRSRLPRRRSGRAHRFPALAALARGAAGGRYRPARATIGAASKRSIICVQTTGDAPAIIATEVDRYVVWPGQACGYELGRREIMRLREVARNELGPAFDLRGFHDAVLLQGEVPLGVLEGLVRDWIPVQRARAARERR